MKLEMKVLLKVLIINRVESESNVEQPCCFEQSARDVTC